MATVRGGEIRQFKIKGREYDVAPEASLELTPSGFDHEHKPAGNGVMVATSKRVLAAIDGVELSIDNGRGDLEALVDFKDSGEPGAINLTLADGTTWAGSLAIEGELKYSSGEGKASFALRGPRLEQI